MTTQPIVPTYCPPEQLQEIIERQAAKYPGPYYWSGWLNNQQIALKAPNGGQYVMGFDKWGLDNAQPIFRAAEGDERVMVPVRHCAVTKHKDSKEIVDIDNPNAIGFQKSWEDIETLLGMTAWQDNRIAELEKRVQTAPIRAFIEIYDEGKIYETELLNFCIGAKRILDDQTIGVAILDWEVSRGIGPDQLYIDAIRTAIGMEKPEPEEVEQG